MNRLKAMNTAKKFRTKIGDSGCAIFNIQENKEDRFFTVSWMEPTTKQLNDKSFYYDELKKGDMVLINDKPYYSTGEKDAFVYHFNAIDDGRANALCYLMTGDYIDLSVNIFGLIETAPS